MNPAPEYLDARQAAAFLGVGLRTLHTLRKADDFPPARVFGERATRWKRAELEQWADDAARKSAAARQEPASLVCARQSRRGTPGGSAGGQAGGLATPAAGKPRRASWLKSAAGVEPLTGAKSNPAEAAA